MKKYVNGEYIEMTSEEIEQLEAEAKEYEYQQRIRPRTEIEGLLALVKAILNEQIATMEDKTLGIQCMALFDTWTPDNYKVGAVRTDPETGYPYECITPHDSISNPDWTIKNRTLWKPWHSRSAEYALPWVQPTGAHDIYKNGEYMIFTDKKIYKCIQGTNFSPTEYAQAWEVQK